MLEDRVTTSEPQGRSSTERGRVLPFQRGRHNGGRPVETPIREVQTDHPFIRGLQIPNEEDIPEGVQSYTFLPPGEPSNTRAAIREFLEFRRKFRQYRKKGKLPRKEAFKKALGEATEGEVDAHGWFDLAKQGLMEFLRERKPIEPLYPEAPDSRLTWATPDGERKDIPGVPQYDGYKFAGEIRLDDEPSELSEARGHILEFTTREAMFDRLLDPDLLAIKEAEEAEKAALAAGLPLPETPEAKQKRLITEALQRDAVVREGDRLFPAMVVDRVTYTEADGTQRTGLYFSLRDSIADDSTRAAAAINAVLDKANEHFAYHGAKTFPPYPLVEASSQVSTLPLPVPAQQQPRLRDVA